MSVFVECYGKRKENSESCNGIKGIEYGYGLLVIKKGKCEKYVIDNSDKKNEIEFEFVEFVMILYEEEFENRDKFVNLEV